jgi:tetratricopeptide (TPR) repeat protein
MSRRSRRVSLYGLGGAAAAALIYGGWLRASLADADTLASCADAELRMGLYESASRTAAAALAQSPRHLHALLIEAHCRDRQGDPRGSRERYRQALAVVADPDLSTEIRIALALEARNRGALPEARDLLEIARPKAAAIASKLAAMADLVRQDLKSGGEVGR